jgi:steroid delta-isomerase-like uncharacterized protein
MNTKTEELNKKIARQSIDANTKGDYDLLEQLSDIDSYQLHYPNYLKPLDYDQTEELSDNFNLAFPDMKVTIENQIAEGDYVVTRMIYQGTHKNEYRGIAATEKKVKISAITIQYIVDGKITEEWTEIDTLGMMQQIGAVPYLDTTYSTEKA